MLIKQWSVNALSGYAFRDISRCQKFDKFERIGSANFDLNLAGNVPDLNVFSEMPVVGL
jgi:hypothetical protein